MTSNREFFVEVCTQTPSADFITRAPAKDWNHSLQVARELVTTMFPEDPMARRVFHNGRFFYQRRNDLGDLVTIQPLVLIGEEKISVVEGVQRPTD